MLGEGGRGGTQRFGTDKDSGERGSARESTLIDANGCPDKLKVSGWKWLMVRNICRGGVGFCPVLSGFVRKRSDTNCTNLHEGVAAYRWNRATFLRKRKVG